MSGLRELLRRYLSDNGFRVTTAGGRQRGARQSGELCLRSRRARRDDAGRKRPRADPRVACRESRVPVLLLTAMAEPEDRVNGLEQGADDYLAKPFEPRELVLRIRNMLQRRPAADPAAREVRFGGLPLRHGSRRTVSRRRDRALDRSRSGPASRHWPQKAGQAVSREELSHRLRSAATCATSMCR